MKNIIIAAGLFVGLFSTSHGGECNGNACVVPRRVVTVTKSVVRETVRLPRRVYNSCSNGFCHSRSVTVVR